MQAQYDRLPDFDDDYRQLAHNVLQKVEKMCEKGFAHGRFLEPVTILGQGRDPNDKSGRKLRRVSFVCMPIFSLETSRRTMRGRKFLGHPARGLMQWRYKLDSTQDRDSKQVAAKSNAAGLNQLVYISYIWALIIGKRRF